MNARHPSAASPYLPLGDSLAETALHLRGPEARVFSEQFAALAARPVAVHVAGDGETFRQALCFPVAGSAYNDYIQPVASVSPCVVIELISHHVICLRLADCSSSRFSLGAFLRSIERSLERVPQGISAWPGIQKNIELMVRRRVVLVDFVLDVDETSFWREYFPRGESTLADALFRGMPPIQPRYRKQAVTALVDIQSAHYRDAVTNFINRLDEDVIQAICASGLPPSVAR